MYYLIQIFRKPIYDGKIPASASCSVAPSRFSLAVLVTGWVYFCHRRDDMAYWS